MLSIQPLASAEGAGSYYLDVVNYYENDSKSIRWLGEGAKRLGIHGEAVEKEQMITLLKGVLPDGTQLGRIDKDGIHHRPGFDMTLSAPKSFSILLESGADPRLADVLDEATEWFVDEIEKEFAQARQIVNGKIEYINTNNFVIAAFRQPSSRANEPQSHVHLVVQNMTHCPDGQWRSLASDMDSQQGVVEQIMKDHIYGGLKFRNKLANITKGLGYGVVSDGDGLWEIEGVPDEVITHYSTRRADIEASMKENGLIGAKGAFIAAKKTRQDKEIIDFDEWKKDIITDCHEMGFDPHALVEQSRKPRAHLSMLQTMKTAISDLFYGKDRLELDHAREAVHVAIESVSQQQAVFDLRALKKDALKHVIGSLMIVDEAVIDEAINEKIADQQLYKAIHPYTQKPLLTTPWQLTLESEAIQRIEDGKGAIEAICSQKTVTDFIKLKEGELDFSLSPSQKKAMTSFLTTTDRFIAIQGYAGTGKTTMLRLTQELASLQGYEIRGITAGSSAANELRTKGGLNASTFARELGRLQQQEQDLSKTIFVIDEASMLSNPQGHKIIKLAEQFNTQLKIIGDKAQLPTPSSGRLFSVLQDYGIQTVAMTDNLRQTDPELKESAIHAGLGEIYDAVEKLTHVEALGTYLERVESIAKKWVAFTPDERNNTLCFAPTHKNRHDITSIIRDHLEQEGGLTGARHDQPTLKEHNLTSIKLRRAVYYSKNDVIRFNNTIARHAIKAGDYLTVEPITADHKKNNTLSLVRDNGKKITFNLSALPKFKAENKDLERPIEVYRQQTLTLMAGDKIQFKRNFESQGIRNSELAIVKTITNDGIEIITNENKTIHLSHGANELRHLDHGYVLTTYASQGKDKKRGLGLIESSNRFASTIQNYYVETTRGISEMIVVTDDKMRLVKAITTNHSDKYSSMDMVTADTLKAHEARFEEDKNSMSLQNTIEKKLTKEQDWRLLEDTVEHYAQAKQQGLVRGAKQLAYTIVSDPALYRLAKERLGFKTACFRRDALSFETTTTFSALPLEARTHFLTVKKYVVLNQQLAKRFYDSKAITALPDINIDPLSGDARAIEPKSLLVNKHFSDLRTIKRNALASVICQDLEGFKPYLKHFSIGELNRIGLPQHEFGVESKKAEVRLESLARHAALDQLREKVSGYVSAHGEKREMIAAQIRRDAKLAHRVVIGYAKANNQQPDSLWKSIHHDAREHSDRLFRNGLSGDAKLAFDQMKDYKKIQVEIRSSWAQQLKQEARSSTTQPDMDQHVAICDSTGNQNSSSEDSTLRAQTLWRPSDPKTTELFARRNELAHQLMNNKSTPDVAAFFKVDRSMLEKSQQKHQYRDNVNAFIESKGDFQARLAVINEIKSDIKGHYPFIKESNLDSTLIGKFLRVTDRQERLDNLSSDEKKDYQLLLHYKMASSNAYQAWQIIHQDNQKNKTPDRVANAMILSSKRDYLANKLTKSPYLETFLAVEKGNKEKIELHGNNHQLKVRKVAEVGRVMNTLSTHYARVESTGTINEAAIWKQEWSVLCNQLKRIEKGAMYQFALQEYPLEFNVEKQINNAIHEKYDTLQQALKKQLSTPVMPALQRIQKAFQYVDANVINESLMADPEQTYKAIWGEPKSENARELRYSGGLIVTLKGSDKGLWHDFTEGVGGAPIQAIMKEHHITFQEALKLASKMTGIYPNDEQVIFAKENKAHCVDTFKSNDLERRNKIISAKSIWNSAIDAKGTLAETYLTKHRGIDNIEQLDVRFWPCGAQWKNSNEQGVLEDKNNKIPALIVAARNEKGELTGVQRIYLDHNTANKNSFIGNAKLSKGVIEGSCGIIQKGMHGSRLYLAEGPETAASIAMADRAATVLVSFGISNMKNLSSMIKTFHSKEIIIAADNDGQLSKSKREIDKTIEVLKQNNIHATALFPDALDGKTKTDWNDILLSKGVLDIQRQLLGHGVTSLKIERVNSILITPNIVNKATIKFNGLDAIKIKDIRDLSSSHTDKNLNNLVADYNKNNLQIHKVQSFSIEKTAPIKINRELEIEL
jgi:conjugative relaxase-like TrwC/TraI family protein